MTNRELEWIGRLLEASGLAGKEYEIEQQQFTPCDFCVFEKGRPDGYVAPEATVGTLPAAEFYAAAPAAVGELLAIARKTLAGYELYVAGTRRHGIESPMTFEQWLEMLAFCLVA